MQLRSSTQSKQRHILATRHLWESYLDDYRDFILYLQAVLLWRRPIDAVCIYVLVHFLLWHILGSSSFLGVLAVLAICIVVAAWFLDTVQVSIPWHQLIPKVQKGHLALSPRPLHAATSSPSLVGADHSGDSDASSTHSQLRHSLQVTPDTETHLRTQSSEPALSWRQRFSQLYSQLLALYLSKLPHVRMRSYQDIVLRLVILKVEASQLFRAVQLARKDNPDKFTIRAVLLLAAVAFLGNSLGTFFVVYSLVYGALLVPPFWVYNIPGRSWKLLRELAPSILRLIKRKYIHPQIDVSEVQSEIAPVPGTLPQPPLLPGPSGVGGGSKELPASLESEMSVPSGKTTKGDDLIESERPSLVSSAPIEPGHVFSQFEDETPSDPESDSYLSEELETDFPRVLLPGSRMRADFGSASPLSTSPTEKKSSSSQFIGFLKRNLSGALKNRPSSPPNSMSISPSPETSKNSGLQSRKVRKTPMSMSGIDLSFGNEIGVERKTDDLTSSKNVPGGSVMIDSPELLRPKRTTKRRRSGSIEPVLLASLTESSLRESSVPEGSIPIPRLRNAPSSPALSPRLPTHEDTDSSSMRPKIPKIPLVLLRGSRDDSVIQAPRYRP